MDLKDKNDITGVPADYSDTESGRFLKKSNDPCFFV